MFQQNMFCLVYLKHFVPSLSETFDVVDHTLWKIQEIGIIPPGLFRHFVGDNTIQKEMVLVPKGAVMSMVKYNALKAFNTLTVPLLKLM